MPQAPQPVLTLLIIYSVRGITLISIKILILLSKQKLIHCRIQSKKEKGVLLIIIQDKIKTLNEYYYLF